MIQKKFSETYRLTARRKRAVFFRLCNILKNSFPNWMMQRYLFFRYPQIILKKSFYFFAKYFQLNKKTYLNN